MYIPADTMIAYTQFIYIYSYVHHAHIERDMCMYVYLKEHTSMCICDEPGDQAELLQERLLHPRTDVHAVRVREEEAGNQVHHGPEVILEAL